MPGWYSRDDQVGYGARVACAPGERRIASPRVTRTVAVPVERLLAAFEDERCASAGCRRARCTCARHPPRNARYDSKNG